MNTTTGRKSSDKNWNMNRNRDKNKNRIRNLNAENASSGEDTQQKLTNQLTDKTAAVLFHTVSFRIYVRRRLCHRDAP